MRPLLAVLCIAATGCVGTFSRSDGEGPFERDAPRWQELGGGPGGVVLRDADDRKHHALVTREGFYEFETHADLHGCQFAAGKIFCLQGEALVAYELPGQELGAPTPVVAVEGARGFAVAGELVAIAREDVVVAGRPGALVPVWQGEATALALDEARGRLWIASRRPLPVIDGVSLDGALLFRVPLPENLESPSLRFVLSGESAAVYALDKPVRNALLVTPTIGAVPLLADSVAQVESATTDASALPALLDPPPPPPVASDDQVALISSWSVPPEQDETLRGRVAALPGNRFLVIDGRSSWNGVEIAIVGSQSTLHVPPPRDTKQGPETVWPRVVEGIAWDDEGAVFVSGNQLLYVDPLGEPLRVEQHPVSQGLRRALNHGINTFVVVGEIVGTVALVGAGAAVIVAAIPVAIVVLPIYAIGSASGNF